MLLNILKVEYLSLKNHSNPEKTGFLMLRIPYLLMIKISKTTKKFFS
jgi:hypothetical protein